MHAPRLLPPPPPTKQKLNNSKPSLTSVNMGTQKIWGVQGVQYYYGKHWCTGYIGVYRVTWVNMGTQDI